MSLYRDDAASSSSEPNDDLDSNTMPPNKVDRASTGGPSPSPGTNGSQPRSRNAARDPLRPRRKKARRACHACQRAHLTCGDERPCMRCVKRNLQDQCADGVRKKAKYLHDTSPEVLAAGRGNHRSSSNAQSLPNIPLANVPHPAFPGAPGNFFPQNGQTSFSHYAPPTQGQMAPPMMGKPSMTLPEYNASSAQPPNQYQSSFTQQVSPVHDLGQGHHMQQGDQTRASISQNFDPSFANANDAMPLNFDDPDYNGFNSHYSKLEIDVLGSMSAPLTLPDVDPLNAMGQSGQEGMGFDNAGNFSGGLGYNQPPYMPWQTVANSAHSLSMQQTNWGPGMAGPDAYAIGEQPASLTGASPHSQNQDYSGYQSTMSPGPQFPQADQDENQDLLRQSLQPARKSALLAGDQQSDATRKRRRKVADVYTSVQAPYSYTQGFHALTDFLKRHYPSKKVLRIAKAMATIRPSFISCNQHLNNADLIFMETCFQRSLWEYDDFVCHYATPTIICRRTGEIAAVSKEFSLVTGWRREVLLGKEPNLNYRSYDPSSTNPANSSQPGNSSRGPATPRHASSVPNAPPSRPQPVFLAELMDEDSVVQFYEDFAELAFGASRTSIIGTPCSLLKYRTKDDLDAKPDPPLRSDAPAAIGSNALGNKDGRVDCQMCWTVRRDVFDIPMLIVMNFLPKI